MAEQQFYTLITNVGQAKLANATALGTKVNFAKLQVGDGKDYNPNEAQENLKHKVWEGSINSITTDSKNPNWIVIQTLIPASVGGFNINEVGVFDDEGNMLIVSKYPETYKPKLENGSGKDLTIKLVIQVSNADSVTLKIDPSITIATKEDIKNVEKQIRNINVPVQSVNGKTGKVILKAEDITAKDGTNLEEFKKDVTTQYEESMKQFEDIRDKNKPQNIAIHINVETGNDDNSGLKEIEAIKTIKRLYQVIALYTHLEEITLHIYGNDPDFYLILEDLKHTVVEFHNNKIGKIKLTDCIDIKIKGNVEASCIECYRSYSMIDGVKIYSSVNPSLYTGAGWVTNAAIGVFDSVLYLKDITLIGDCDTIFDAFESTVFLIENIKGNDVKFWFTNNHSNNNRFESIHYSKVSVISVKYTVSKFHTLQNGGVYTE